jgi:hypothetical protein
MSSPERPETILAQRVGCEQALLLASGSAAIEVALDVLGVGVGDEVIVPDVGCHQVPAAVARRGATAVFAGVGESLTLAPSDVLAALSASTKAVIGVHQYGLACDVRSIRAILPNNVSIIEDFAQAWQLSLGGEPAGGLGDLSVTSFGRTKPLALGAGGALLGSCVHLDGVVAAHCGQNDRQQPILPSGARFPAPLLGALPDAIRQADLALAARRAAVQRILAELVDFDVEPPAVGNSQPSWTRLPLYGPERAVARQMLESSPFVELVEEMHLVPPSALPMFRGTSKRIVNSSTRVAEPILVKPSARIVTR